MSSSGSLRLLPSAAQGGDHSSDYELCVHPSCGGTYKGIITFTLPSGMFLWYNVELHVAQCAPEAELSLSCAIRKAVAVQITINNPNPNSNTKEAFDFDVTLNGNGVLGNEVIRVEGGQSSVYELIYSPVLEGKEEGSVIFFSPSIGEFWYQLHLVAEQAEPSSLPLMIAEMGKMEERVVWMENPIEEIITVNATSSNIDAFHVNPPCFSVPPFGKASCAIVFHPSVTNREEEAKITLQSNFVGDWVYLVKGLGTPPTAMEPTIVSASFSHGRIFSIAFHNPMLEEVSVQCKVVHNGEGESEGQRDALALMKPGAATATATATATGAATAT
jgi:hypothetical protein